MRIVRTMEWRTKMDAVGSQFVFGPSDGFHSRGGGGFGGVSMYLMMDEWERRKKVLKEENKMKTPKTLLDFMIKRLEEEEEVNTALFLAGV